MVINLTVFEVLFSAMATRAATLFRHIGRITLTFTFESAWLKTGLKLSPKNLLRPTMHSIGLYRDSWSRHFRRHCQIISKNSLFTVWNVFYYDKTIHLTQLHGHHRHTICNSLYSCTRHYWYNSPMMPSCDNVGLCLDMMVWVVLLDLELVSLSYTDHTKPCSSRACRPHFSDTLPFSPSKHSALPYQHMCPSVALF